MKKVKIKFNYKGKSIFVDGRKIPSESTGLMFVRREKAKALLFEFKKDIKLSFSSLFVFFPFMILWLDESNSVIDKQIIKPFNWRIVSKKPYRKVLEIPINSKYKEIVNILDG